MVKRGELVTIGLLALLVCVFFWPVFLKNQVAMNANNLVSTFVPWQYEQHQGRAVASIAKPGMLDQLRLYIPYLIFMQKEFKAGRIPLWNPHNFSGTPLAAELQSAVFYPTNLLLLITSVPNYWNILIILGYALTVIFTYVYTRSLGLPRMYAGFAGMVFAFSSFMVAWSQEVLMAIHSIAWLPLLLLASDRFLARPGRKWWAVFVFGCTMSLLSGYLQTSLYVFLFVLAYMLWRSKWTSYRLVLLLIFGMAVAVLVNALQFLPAHELYSLSSRKVVDFRYALSQYLLQLPWLLTYVFPDFFGHPTTRNETLSFVGTYYERAISIGTIPFLLALFAVATRSKSESPKIIGWYALLWLVTLSLSLQLPLSYLPFYLDVPFFATGISNRILFLPAFCASVLGAYGLHALVRQNRKVLWIILLLVPLGVGIFIWWYSPMTEIPNIRRDWVVVARRNAIVPIGLVAVALASAVLFQRRVGVVVALLFTLSLLQIYYGFAKFMPFTDQQYFYPEHPVLTKLSSLTKDSYERFWGYGGSTFDYPGAYIENNLATAFGLYAVEGYDSLHDHRYGQMLFTSSNGQVQINVSRSDAILERAPDVGQSFIDQTKRLQLLKVLGVRYIVDRDEEAPRESYRDPQRFIEPLFKKIWQQDKWRIFEFQDALPRVWLVDERERIQDGQAIVDHLLDPAYPLLHRAISEEPLAEFDLTPIGTKSAKIIQYLPQSIIIHTKTEAPQFLVLSDAYFPGWHVFIDGQESSIVRTNFSLRGVPIPAGEHAIAFTYEPGSFKQGIELSVLGLVLVFVLSVSWKRTFLSKV